MYRMFHMYQCISACCCLVWFAAPAFPQAAPLPQSAVEKQRKISDAAYYRKWLAEDVGYIATDEERTAFKALLTDAAREQFAQQFWRRRDPTPDTVENEYREEYYRRLAYANEQFATNIPGWKTERGIVYIKYGPPDERTVPGGANGGVPYERWLYHYMENFFAPNVEIEFVDATGSGDFRVLLDPPEREALLGPGGAAQAWCKQVGPCKPTQHFQNTATGFRLVMMQGTEAVGPPKMNVKLPPAPVAKFQDLEAAVNAAAKSDLLPMKVQTDFIPVTGSSVLSNITIQFDRKDLQFKQKGEISSAAVNLYARVTSLSHRPATWFEDVVSVDIPTNVPQQPLSGAATYLKSVPLQPGRYRLDIAAKDTVSGKTTSFETTLEVPLLESARLGRSSLILADQLEQVPSANNFGSPFVIGASKVRPRVGANFKREETLGIYLQVYNFQTGGKTEKADGTVEYAITRTGSGKKVFELTEQVSAISGGASQVVIQKSLPLRDLGIGPGQYTLKIKVADKRRNQTVEPSATFTVT